MTIRAVVIRRQQTLGTAVLIEGTFERKSFLASPWSDSGGLVFDTSAINKRYTLGGRTKNEFIPIDLSNEPEIASVIASLEDDDVEDADRDASSSAATAIDTGPVLEPHTSPADPAGDEEVLNDDGSVDST